MNQDLIDLQTRLAFQEETINQLNEVVTDQQARIDRLRQEVQWLGARYQEVLDAMEAGEPGASLSEKPPHY